MSTFAALIATAIVCYTLGAFAADADRYGLRDLVTKLGEAFELGRFHVRDRMQDRDR